MSASQPSPAQPRAFGTEFGATAQHEAQWREADHHTCVICIDELVAGEQCVALPCDHVFHKACVCGWFERNRVCPTCRQPSDLANLPPPRPLCRGCGRPFDRPPNTHNKLASYYRCSNCTSMGIACCLM